MIRRPDMSVREDGAALLSILMVVAAMSVAALITMRAISAATQVAQITRDRSDAYWMTRSGEMVGAALIQDLFAATSGNIRETTPGLGEPLNFPLDRGQITAVVSDATNCFNLNSLAEPATNGWDISDESLADYKRLLTAAGLTEYDADRLGDSLADWIDSDTLPRANGAEDAYYSSLDAPYRTAGGPLENIRELRAIGPYSPDTIEMIAQLLCVRPTTEQAPLNVNTLAVEQFPLLPALLSHDIEALGAQRALESRPTTGWDTVQTLLNSSEFEDVAPDRFRPGSIGLQSRYFSADGFVSVSGTVNFFSLLYAIDASGQAQLIWRRYGED